MERYAVTENDRELIALGLKVLSENFDDGVYNHTVGCGFLPWVSLCSQAR